MELGDPSPCAREPAASWATKLSPVALLAAGADGRRLAVAAPPVAAELAAPAEAPPELPLPAAPALPKAEPLAPPVVPVAPVTLDVEEPVGARCDSPAAPDEPPAPLLPVAARPEEVADPDTAVPEAFADPLPVPVPVPEPPAPVEPDDWLEVCDAGPEGPEEPPAPEPETLLDVGLELAGPLVPPVAAAPVVDPPLLPVEALPEELPVEPPLEPPVEVPVDEPLPPLPVEVPVPLPEVLPLVTAAGPAGAGAGEGLVFRTAANATVEIRPITAGNGRRLRLAKQPMWPPKHRSATSTALPPEGDRGHAAWWQRPVLLWVLPI